MINKYQILIHYSDIAMETLLQEVKSVMEKQTKLKLSETYSYAEYIKKEMY